MLRLNPKLLKSDNKSLLNETGYIVHGSYNSMQFVLRLSSEIHKQLSAVQPGLQASNRVNFDQLQAFSTYLHETIHWWQHVGSTYGFIASLMFPLQAHQCAKDLKELTQEIGPVKSIAELDYENSKRKINNPKVNRILNYWIDLESAIDISLVPSNILSYLEKPSFDSIGHAYYITWSTAIHLLSSFVDMSGELLPKIEKWKEPFQKLREEKALFFNSEPSQISIPAFGAKAIFEGQARFSQIQYLFYSTGGKIHFEQFQATGLLEGIYGEAFAFYLNRIGEPIPKLPSDSLVALFLLVCDFSINSSDGFPFDLYSFNSFVHSVDPGWRFLLCCDFIKENPDLKTRIVEYSSEEYIEVCERLTKTVYCISPYYCALFWTVQCEENSSFAALLKEEENFQFQDDNMPVRLFFSKFLRMQQDKSKHPHFFCWPGRHMVARLNQELDVRNSLELFHKHQALYINDENDKVSFTISDRFEFSKQEDTFNQFYAWNCCYDMVRQWIIKEGPFRYEYQWLVKNYDEAEMKSWVDNIFKRAFGVAPDNFRIFALEY